MIEIRASKDYDIPLLKDLWQRSFGDSQAFIDFYFEKRFQPENTLVLSEHGKICAMLTLIEVSIVAPAGRILPAGMLYAIATHPDFRRRGLAGRIMGFAQDLLAEQGKICSIVVPADLELYDFYHKQGYVTGFAVRELKLTRADISGLSHLQGAISAISPEEYNERRERICRSLKEVPFVRYRDQEIEYQKKLSQFSGADIYGITAGKWAGCAAVERYSRDKLMIKELLLPGEALEAGLKLLAETLQAEEYTVRTPVGLAKQLGGVIRPFGMALQLKKSTGFDLMMELGHSVESKEQQMEKPAVYLGLAFD